VTTIIETGDPLAVAAVAAIHAGDTARLRQLLAEHPELATATLGTDSACGMTRSLLHVATDWPGHYPNVADTIAILVAAGADAHARFTGPPVGSSATAVACAPADTNKGSSSSGRSGAPRSS
jgi:uncharacterized protein